MKKFVLSICNSLMAMSITHSLTQTGGFQIASIRPGCREIARECADASADVLLMEAAFNIWKMTFLGDGPAIGTGAFKGLTATAYYPGGNLTWTAEIMQNYGGKIT